MLTGNILRIHVHFTSCHWAEGWMPRCSCIVKNNCHNHHLPAKWNRYPWSSTNLSLMITLFCCMDTRGYNVFGLPLIFTSRWEYFNSACDGHIQLSEQVSALHCSVAKLSTYTSQNPGMSYFTTFVEHNLGNISGFVTQPLCLMASVY